MPVFAVIATGSTPATTRSEAMPTPATELAALQSTVNELAGQMAWFVQRLSEDDVVIAANKVAGDGLATDSPVDGDGLERELPHTV